MKRKSLCLQMAVEYIKKSIQNGEFLQEEYLPAVSALASKADVSYYTMWKALKEFRQKGIISGGTRGKRLRLISAKPFNDSKEPAHQPPGVLRQNEISFPKYAWQRLQERIDRDVLQGVFFPGKPLPTFKELQYRYNTSYRTLRKSLHALREQGILEPYKCGYRVTDHVSRSSENVVVVLRLGPYDNFGIFGRKVLECIEQESYNRRLVLKNFLYNSDNDRLCFFDPNNRTYDAIPDTDKVSAYILLDISLHREWHEVIRYLNSLKKPVAVFDLTGKRNVAALPGKYRNFFVFPATADSYAGRQVGRYLLGLGHRKIAFISLHPEREWARDRYRALKTTYREAGIPEGVVEFAKTSMSIQDELLSKRKEIAWKFLESFEETVGNTDIPASQLIDSNLLGALNKSHMNSVAFKLLMPLFETALSDPAISAWVCANDVSAVFALEFLRHKNIRVPGRISVMGFDNSMESVNNNLTSFDFDIRGSVNAILYSVLYPYSSKRHFRFKAIEQRGMIIERGTTKKC